jgi:hypothetical protein
MSGEEHITTAEAAAILGVGSGWVAALCRNGVLNAAGGGKGAPWRIDQSSVHALAVERSKPVDPMELENVAREIEEDREAQQLAKERAEESFRDRVISIAKRHGLGVLCVVAGVATTAWAPGNLVGPILITEGIRELIQRLRPSSDSRGSERQIRGKRQSKSR